MPVGSGEGEGGEGGRGEGARKGAWRSGEAVIRGGNEGGGVARRASSPLPDAYSEVSHLVN